MSEIGHNDYPRPQEQPGSEVVINTLQNPPSRRQPDAGLASSILMAQRRSTPPEHMWEPKNLTENGKNVNYVPMNSCAQANFEGPGYLGTGNLNGCIAVAVGYSDERDTIHAFLAHYDSETVREIDENGKLKISKLITEFAGQNAVKLAIAYPKIHTSSPPNEDTYNPEDFPVPAIIRGAKELSKGTNVLLIPYDTSDDINKGNIFSVGLAGSYRMDFGWNGQRVEVGEAEEWDDRRQKASKALASAMQSEIELDLID